MAFDLTTPQLEALLAGRKTQHRTPRCSPTEHAGRSYAIRRRVHDQEADVWTVKRTDHRAIVTAMSRSVLGHTDTRAEGFKSLDAYMQHWELHYGPWSPLHPVTVYTITLDTREPVRLLTPTARPAHTELGYTTEPHAAMRDEPEAVDTTHLARYSADARTRFTDGREGYAYRQAKLLAQNITQEAIAAGRRGADITTQLADLHRTLQEIRQARSAA